MINDWIKEDLKKGWSAPMDQQQQQPCAACWLGDI
ncbi:hypothetical protein C8P68_103445 [Mucilaginibacter yixingensis]|uniref:Uncharacterized protein n=1 Tax=Mucilaginibacter yixingensis TaxID=1295612 RepID=A0A2T5JBN9_9SPHI|nr:hypothetical protein C8P68_103445 [Mucilaginibacter yixingensis]